MKIKVLFDKSAKDSNLKTGWGLSFLIDDRILFDTGEEAGPLLFNMKALGVEIDRLEAIVISHDHWDHTGGLSHILRQGKGIKLYACPGFSQEFRDKAVSFKARLIEVDKKVEIDKNIYTTAEIAASYKGQYLAEQALVVKTENGISVLTGCAHPGIIKILEKVKDDFPQEKFYFVGGGFHLASKNEKEVEEIVQKFRELKVEKAAPTHCSGKEAEEIFRSNYNSNFIRIKVGQEISL